MGSENGVHGAGAGGASGGSTGDQQPLTRYRIFKTENDGLTLEYVGHQLAKSSDAALREFLDADTVGHFCAVNENSIKLRNLKPRPGPVIESEPLAWPEPPAPVESLTDSTSST